MCHKMMRRHALDNIHLQLLEFHDSVRGQTVEIKSRPDGGIQSYLESVFRFVVVDPAPEVRTQASFKALMLP